MVAGAAQVREFSRAMEKLAGEAKGAWLLARVGPSRELNPELAQALPRMRAPSPPSPTWAFQGSSCRCSRVPVREPQLRQAIAQVFEQLGVAAAAR